MVLTESIQLVWEIHLRHISLVEIVDWNFVFKELVRPTVSRDQSNRASRKILQLEISFKIFGFQIKFELSDFNIFQI